MAIGSKAQNFKYCWWAAMWMIIFVNIFIFISSASVYRIAKSMQMHAEPHSQHWRQKGLMSYPINFNLRKITEDVRRCSVDFQASLSQQLHRSRAVRRRHIPGPGSLARQKRPDPASQRKCPESSPFTFLRSWSSFGLYASKPNYRTIVNRSPVILLSNIERKHSHEKSITG